MKKAMTTSNIIGTPKKAKRPIIVETINSTREKAVNPVFEKKVYLSKVPVPDGHIRVMVLIDYKGMTDELYKGDVLDLPDRRYKTLSNRGLVEAYNGDRPPNKMR
jgi:hypothetical protein